MATIKTYSITRRPGTASDADAIVDRVNSLTAGNGDSLHRDRVWAEAMEIVNKIAARGHMTAEEIVDLYGLKIVETDNEIEVNE